MKWTEAKKQIFETIEMKNYSGNMTHELLDNCRTVEISINCWLRRQKRQKRQHAAFEKNKDERKNTKWYQQQQQQIHVIFMWRQCF